MNCTCGAVDLPPIYSCWEHKRKAYNEPHTLWCSNCKKTMTAGSDAGWNFTEEERRQRQIGMPCLRCGTPYKAKRAYHQVRVCKKCGQKEQQE